MPIGMSPWQHRSPPARQAVLGLDDPPEGPPIVEDQLSQALDLGSVRHVASAYRHGSFAGIGSGCGRLALGRGR
jgi:hypothetical protein